MIYKLIARLSSKSDDETFKPMLDSLFSAHLDAAANNENASSSAAKLASGSGDLSKTIMAALATTGGVHAPVTETRLFLYYFNDNGIKQSIDNGKWALGFGNSFHKGEIDPSWAEFEAAAHEHMPDEMTRIMAIYNILKSEGKDLYPNAAAFTAAFAEHYGMEIGSEPLLFILPRVFVWTEYHLNQPKNKMPVAL